MEPVDDLHRWAGQPARPRPWGCEEGGGARRGGGKMPAEDARSGVVPSVANWWSVWCRGERRVTAASGTVTQHGQGSPSLAKGGGGRARRGSHGATHPHGESAHRRVCHRGGAPPRCFLCAGRWRAVRTGVCGHVAGEEGGELRRVREGGACCQPVGRGGDCLRACLGGAAIAAPTKDTGERRGVGREEA